MNKDKVFIGETVYFVDNNSVPGQEQQADGEFHRGKIVDILGETVAVGFLDEDLELDPRVVITISPDDLYTAEDALNILFDNYTHHSLIAKTAFKFMLTQK